MISAPWVVGTLALAIPTLLVVCAVVAGGSHRDDIEWAVDDKLDATALAERLDHRFPLDELEGPI